MSPKRYFLVCGSMQWWTPTSVTDHTGAFASCLLGEATNYKWIQNINVVVSQFYDPIVVVMFLKHF